MALGGPCHQAPRGQEGLSHVKGGRGCWKGSSLHFSWVLMSPRTAAWSPGTLGCRQAAPLNLPEHSALGALPRGEGTLCGRRSGTSGVSVAPRECRTRPLLSRVCPDPIFLSLISMNRSAPCCPVSWALPLLPAGPRSPRKDRVQLLSGSRGPDWPRGVCVE